MIESRRHPRSGRVAQVTGVVADDMVRRLTSCYHAIMAAIAGANDIRMIDPYHRGPSRIAVTILADIVGLDVGAVLTGYRGTIVATRTVSRYIGVIEIRRNPALGCMAIATLIYTYDMIRGLTCRSNAVVAVRTGALDVSMIDPGHGYPAVSAVAGVAELCRGYMT